MHVQACLLAMLIFSFGVAPAKAEDLLKEALRSAQRSTLDQKGTHPFHLKAVLAPSFERDISSGRTGDIEIWWTAPGVYRRELRSSGFHQIEIVNQARVWQKNEGDYMPDWLDEIAESFLRPLPPQSLAMRGVPPDLNKTMMGAIYLNWEKPLPMDMQPPKEVVAIRQDTGLLFYDGGLGWGGLWKDYIEFHGRFVPFTVSDGSPEVTAKVVLLEDLKETPADWFDASAFESDEQQLRFVAVETTNLEADVEGKAPPLIWPEIPNTRQSGVIWTDLVLDSQGTIREPFDTISDNPAINEFMHTYLAGLHFKPILANGKPVQTIRHVVLWFELGKPAGPRKPDVP